MSALNLLYLLPGDSQSTATDKINFNFDQILSMGGGPIGLTGLTGPQGPIGPQGIIGLTGAAGSNGTVWTTGSGAPTSTSANADDMYLDTASGDIYTYSGISWSVTGTLTISGLFKSATTSTTSAFDIIMSGPGAGVSLVLSELDYNTLGVEPTQSTELLKIVGRENNPDLIRFSSQLPGNVEMLAAYNPTIKLSNTNPGVDTIFNLAIDNPTGSITLSGSSNFFTIQSNGDYEFVNTGSSAKLKFELSSAAERHVSFSTASSGTNKFHIGRQDYTTSSNKLFTIVDNGKIGINNPSPTYQVDKTMPSLGLTLGATNNWDRFVGPVQNGNDSLVTRHIRNFAVSASTSAWKSADVRISKLTDITIPFIGTLTNFEQHFISFAGGAKDATDLTAIKPQLRMGYSGANYFSLTAQGSLMLASDSVIKDIGIGTNPVILPSKLHVQYASTASLAGTNSHAGIHLMTAGADGNFVGITASGSNNGGTNRQYQTAAGLLFETQAPAGAFAGGVAAHLMTSHYGSAGQKKRYTWEAEGGTKHWANDNTNHFFETNVNSGVVKLQSYDWGTSTFRNVIFNEYNSIIDATGSASGSYTGFFGIGTGAPKTMVHITGATTIGTRATIPTAIGSTAYSTYAGLNSFTVGTGHKAAGTNSVILSGGSGHTISSAGSNSVIIGHNGTDNVNLTVANKVVLGAQTYLGWSQPSFDTYNTAVANNINAYGTYTGNTRDLLKLNLPEFNDVSTGYNGIEIETILDSSIVSSPGTSPTAGKPYALLVTEVDEVSFPATVYTKFLLDTKGNVGIGTDLIPSIEGGYPSAWTSIPTFKLLPSNNTTHIDISSLSLDGHLTIKSASNTNNLVCLINNGHYIETSNSSDSTSGTLYKNALFIKSGLNKNKNTSTGSTIGGSIYLLAGDAVVSGTNGTTTGGDLYLAGGNAQSSSSTGTKTGGNVRIVGGDGSTSAGNVILGHNGTSMVGKVGIGTSSPTASLEVYGEVKMARTPTNAIGYTIGKAPLSGSGTLVSAQNYDRFINVFTDETYQLVDGSYEIWFTIGGTPVGHWFLYNSSTLPVGTRNSAPVRNSSFLLPAGYTLAYAATNSISGGDRPNMFVVETKFGK